MVEAPEDIPDWYFNDQYESEISEEEFAQDPFTQDLFGQDWIEPNDTLYPVLTREKSSSSKPYDKKVKKVLKKKKTPKVEPMVEDDEIFTEPVPKSESVKETNIRRIKKYRQDAWDIVKETVIPIQIQDFLQYSPTAKNQVRIGISKIKPDYVTEEQQTRLNALELKQSRKPKMSSAYIQVSINNRTFQGIIDTGAATCVISHDLCLLLKWTIDASNRRTVTIADGNDMTSLGVVKEVPFTIAGCTISMDAMVVKTHSYDILLGNDWLHKARARIDISAQKIQIEQHGQKHVIPLSFNKGQVSRFRAEDEEEEIRSVDDEETDSSETDDSPQSSSEEEDNNIYYLSESATLEKPWNFERDPSVSILCCYTNCIAVSNLNHKRCAVFDKWCKYHHQQAQQFLLGTSAQPAKWKEYHDLLIHSPATKWSAPITDIVWTIQDEKKLFAMSPKPEEPVNDWHKVRSKKPTSWNGEQTDVNPEEWDVTPQSTTKHLKQPTPTEPMSFRAQRFDQNLKNRKCPHGT
jgi:hypothetical protein